MSARAVGLVALFVASCIACASDPERAAPTLAAPTPASPQARALIEASLTRRPIRTLPAYTKMALVKLLPHEAPALADDVDRVLDDAAFLDDVARRVDEALSPAESAELTAALRSPAIALVLSLLLGEAAPSFRPPAGGATREHRELLFEAVMTPGRGTTIAQLPLELAARIARAALPPSDPRQADLARFLAELPTLDRLEERDAFVAALEVARPHEVEEAAACFLGGPCARAHDVLYAAHVAAAHARAADLEALLKARPVGASAAELRGTARAGSAR